MASRFWVGGSGTWDNSTTTNWSATTGGAGGASVPGAADNVWIDGNSGIGTITVGAVTISANTINCTAMSGLTLNCSTNNPNFNLSGSLFGSGTQTRTISMGNGTWTFSNSSGILIDFTTVTGLTLNANQSLIVFSNTNPAGTRTFGTGNKTFNNFSVVVPTLANAANIVLTGAPVCNTVTIGPRTILIHSGLSVTSLTAVGNSTSHCMMIGDGFTASVTVTTSSNIQWAYLQNITFLTTSPIANNSFNGGGLSGVTVTQPGAGVGLTLPRIIGG